MTKESSYLLQHPGCTGTDGGTSSGEMTDADATPDLALRALDGVFPRIACVPACLIAKRRVGG